MKKIKRLEPKNLYLIRSSANANCTFVENKEELQNFWKLFHPIFRDYLEVVEHYVGPAGFEMIIRIYSDSRIQNVYERHKRLKGKEYILHSKSSWRIISERFQIFLGQYVLAVNRKRECDGGLTKGRFERFIFENESEYEALIVAMRKNRIPLDQKNPRYRRKKGHYSIDRMEAKLFKYWNSVKYRECVLGVSIDNQWFANSFVTKIINKTKNFHFHHNPT